MSREIFFGGRVIFEVDFAEGAEEEAIEVGEDGSATWGDAVLDEENGEFGEEVVDLRGGFEFGELAVEIRGEIDGVGLGGLETGVTEAQARFGIRDGEAALAAFGGEVAAARETGGAGWSVFCVHFNPRSIPRLESGPVGIPAVAMKRVRSDLIAKELGKINGAEERVSV